MISRLKILARPVCALRGHGWRPIDPLLYESVTTLLEGYETPVTWVCDEVCSRCGRESWWPA